MTPTSITSETVLEQLHVQKFLAHAFNLTAEDVADFHPVICERVCVLLVKWHEAQADAGGLANVCWVSERINLAYTELCTVLESGGLAEVSL